MDDNTRCNDPLSRKNLHIHVQYIDKHTTKYLNIEEMTLRMGQGHVS
uniref:Uncharacterized protein n=1 Tax=Lepeophtheirus salmonis TaxID=72036 RepID=A0A0K2UEP4_LEPSM